MLELNELLHIIYLFEYCQHNQLTQRTGYQGGKTGNQDKQIQSIVGAMDEKITTDTIFKETQQGLYEITCFLNTLNSLIANEYEETHKKRIAIKEQLFLYLKKVNPILAPTKRHKYISVTDIAESIMSTKALLQYCEKKKKKNKVMIFKQLIKIEDYALKR